MRQREAFCLSPCFAPGSRHGANPPIVTFHGLLFCAQLTGNTSFVAFGRELTRLHSNVSFKLKDIGVET